MTTIYEIAETIEMTGTPKQIAWAQELRAKRIGQFRRHEERMADRQADELAEIYECIGWSEPDARYWIESRSGDIAGMPIYGETLRQRVMGRPMDDATRANLESRSIVFWAALSAHKNQNLLANNPARLVNEIAVA